MLLFGIRFYQAIFAHLMPIGCKFYPSCSRYAAEAIERHGAARGARLALARLWRCRPFTCKADFDLAPDAHEVANGAAEAASPSANEAEGGVRAEVSLGEKFRIKHAWRWRLRWRLPVMVGWQAF